MSTKVKRIIRSSLITFFVYLFMWSGYNVFIYAMDYIQLNKSYEEAQSLVQIDTNPQEDSYLVEDMSTEPTEDFVIEDIATEETEPVDEFKDLKISIGVDWESLRAQSQDVVGWLYIPDSNMNYPLMHRDNLYYLDHDYQGKYNVGGSLFLDARLDIDVQNVIVYGHHMKSDTMFHRLTYYAKQDYADEHKYIYVATPEETRLYQVFSVEYTQGGSSTYTWEFGEDGDMMLEDYANRAILNSVVETETRKIVEEDRILSLSTCSGRSSTERLVVHAVLLTSY